MITLFGSTPVEMDPARFSELAPHLQTEFLLLASERGLSSGIVRRMSGLAADTLEEKRRQTHRVRAFEFERTVSAVTFRDGPKCRMPPDMVRLLEGLHRNGGKLSLHREDLEEACGIAVGRGLKAVRYCREKGYVQTLDTGNRVRPPHYVLTDEGRAEVERLLDGEGAAWS